MIKIVDAGIVKKYEIDGSIILYKEALPRDVERLYQQFTGMKKDDFSFDVCGIRDEVLTHYVVGWENVQDANGNDIPFTIEMLAGLPSEVRNNLYSLVTVGKVQ